MTSILKTFIGKNITQEPFWWANCIANHRKWCLQFGLPEFTPFIIISINPS